MYSLISFAPLPSLMRGEGADHWEAENDMSSSMCLMASPHIQLGFQGVEFAWGTSMSSAYGGTEACVQPQQTKKVVFSSKPADK